MKLHLMLCVISLVGLAGCGEKVDLKITPVSGIVTLNGQPLAEADVSAIPTGATMGLGGGGRSDSKGEFKFTHARGEAGLPPGEYKVTVSLRKKKDGSVPPPNDPTPPIESDATETIGAQYSDPNQTKLTLTVPPASTPVEFKLEGAQK